LLSMLPRPIFRSRKLEYMVVISDTFLVSLALFHAGLEQVHLPLVFFMTLLLAALGPDLPRMIAGTTLVAGLYFYLTWRGGLSDPGVLSTVLMRIPFLYVAGLYYGHLVHHARMEQDLAGRVEREKRKLETFLEVTSATTSTLDLHEVLYVIVQRIASLVGALRCSILTVDDRRGRCAVLASSDDPKISGLQIDLGKYPEVRKAIETRRPVVINNIDQEALLDGVRERLETLGIHSIMVL